MRKLVLPKHIVVPIVLLASLSAIAPAFAGGAPTVGSSWPVATTFYNQTGANTFLLNGSTFTITYDGMADSYITGQPHSPSSTPLIPYSLSAPPVGFGGGTVSEIKGNQGTAQSVSASNGGTASGSMTVAQGDSATSVGIARGLGVDLNFSQGGHQSLGSGNFNIYIVWKITGPNGNYSIRLAEGIYAKATSEAFVWGIGSQLQSSTIQTTTNDLGFGGTSTATVAANANPGFSMGNSILVSNGSGPVYKVDVFQNVTIANGVGYFAINVPPGVTANNNGAGDSDATAYAGYQPIQVANP